MTRTAPPPSILLRDRLRCTAFFFDALCRSLWACRSSRMASCTASESFPVTGDILARGARWIADVTRRYGFPARVGVVPIPQSALLIFPGALHLSVKCCSGWVRGTGRGGASIFGPDTSAGDACLQRSGRRYGLVLGVVGVDPQRQRRVRMAQAVGHGSHRTEAPCHRTLTPTRTPRSSPT